MDVHDVSVISSTTFAVVVKFRKELRILDGFQIDCESRVHSLDAMCLSCFVTTSFPFSVITRDRLTLSDLLLPLDVPIFALRRHRTIFFHLRRSPRLGERACSAKEFFGVFSYLSMAIRGWR